MLFWLTHRSRGASPANLLSPPRPQCTSVNPFSRSLRNPNWREPMSSELAVMEVSPLSILQSAVDKGASIEQITALMGLAERFEYNQDKRAFRQAMAAFKLDPPKITKNKHVSFKTDRGVTEYDHATLDNVCDQIVKRLAESGITHRWVPKQEGGLITVTCILSLGTYSEETPLSSGPDTSGGKNAIQAIASAVSYLERYTLLGATGTATGMKDDDGKSSELPDAVQMLVADILAAGDLADLQTVYSGAMKTTKKTKDDQPKQKAYIDAYNARKGQLSKEVVDGK